MRKIIITGIIGLTVIYGVLIASVFGLISYNVAWIAMIICLASTLLAIVTISRTVKDTPAPHWHDDVHVMD